MENIFRLINYCLKETISLFSFSAAVLSMLVLVIVFIVLFLHLNEINEKGK